MENNKYLTRAKKQIACELAGMSRAFDVLLTENIKEIAGFEKRIKTMQTYALNLITHVLKGINADQAAYMIRQTENLELRLVARDIARSMPSLVILDAKDVQELCRAAQWQCIGCELDKKEQKNCQRKGLFLRCGAITTKNEKGVCPFKKGL